MKSHHAAALALVGWYLMAPPMQKKDAAPSGPLTPKEIRVRSDAPLLEWTQLGSYDSAKDCESAKAALATKHRLYYNVNGESLEQTKENLRNQNFWTLAQQLSLCIASDDPRLKGK